jgi:tetratricopeptide (TPR) repeat protein
MAAPRALPGTPQPRFVDAMAPLLSDPVRAVRIEAARALAGTDLAALNPEQQTAMVKATAELVAAEKVDADRPETYLNLGLLDLRRRELPRPRPNTAPRCASTRTSCPHSSIFPISTGRAAWTKRVRSSLKKAMTIEPDNADVRYALGPYLVRKHDYAGALDLLRWAHELLPDNARYAYVYAVALNSSGAAKEALSLLEEAHQQHPADRNILTALVSIARDHGDFAAALRHARELLALDPGNAQLQGLITELEKKSRP